MLYPNAREEQTAPLQNESAIGAASGIDVLSSST